MIFGNGSGITTNSTKHWWRNLGVLRVLGVLGIIGVLGVLGVDIVP
jgi:hypothetical protein